MVCPECGCTRAKADLYSVWCAECGHALSEGSFPNYSTHRLTDGIVTGRPNSTKFNYASQIHPSYFLRSGLLCGFLVAGFWGAVCFGLISFIGSAEIFELFQKKRDNIAGYALNFLFGIAFGFFCSGVFAAINTLIVYDFQVLMNFLGNSFDFVSWHFILFGILMGFFYMGACRSRVNYNTVVTAAIIGCLGSIKDKVTYIIALIIWPSYFIYLYPDQHPHRISNSDILQSISFAIYVSALLSGSIGIIKGVLWHRSVVLSFVLLVITSAAAIAAAGLYVWNTFFK